MKNQQIKIIFLGTPEFAVKPLEALISASGIGYEIKGIITAPDKPIGRKQILTSSPVKLLAEKHNLPIFQPKNKTELLEIMKKLRPDLAIVAAFGIILTKEMLDIPKYGFLNVHPSLLPRWRGASPIQSAILAGDEKTGVSIILLNEKMDEGPILVQKELKVEKRNLKELENNLSELGAQLLIETIPKWIDEEIKPREQNSSNATYTKKIEKEDGLIDWNETPEITERKIRAFTPWPGAYTFIDGKPACAGRRLIVTEAEIKNTSLKIKRVKPEGKNEMNFRDYLAGNPDENLKKYL